MKRIIVLIAVFVGSAALYGCGGEVVQVYYEDENMRAHEFFVGENEYYFLYPDSARVSGERVEFSEGDCEVVNFGNFERLKEIASGREDLEDVVKGGGDLIKSGSEVWKTGEVVVLYGRSMKNNDFGIWAFVDAQDISACKPYVDDIFESLTDKTSYIRDQYGFDVNSPYGFEPEYFDTGIFLRKETGDYVVGIGAKSFDNESGYGSVGDYVAFEYPGYDSEFAEIGDFVGYFVNVVEGDDAFRHFFTLSDDGRTIYEVYMVVPGIYFSEHLDDLEFVVESLRTLK